VSEGGVRAGKNIMTIYTFCEQLEHHPNDIHLIAGYSIGNAGALIYKSDDLGIERYFKGRIRVGKYEDKPCYYVYTATGEKVILKAGGSNKKGQDAIAGYTFGMAYITEANRCDLDFVQEVFKRTISSQDRKVFHDLNPKSDQHPYYTDILNYHEEQQAKDPNYGFNYGHFTMADNLSITDEQIIKVLQSFEKGTLIYDRDILGLRRQAEGLVYSHFNYDLHTVEPEDRPYQEFWVSNDYGVQHPCVFLLFGRVGNTWYVVDEYYHNGEKDGQKTVEDNYKALTNLIGKRRIDTYVRDNAPIASSFNVHLKRVSNLYTRKAKDAVMAGIEDVTMALTTGKLKINRNCKKLIQETSLYMWDSDSDKDEPLKINDDAWSAVRYFVHTNGFAKADWK